MKRFFPILILSLAGCLISQAATFTHDKWTINLDETTKLLTIHFDDRVLLDGAFAEARMGDALLQSTDAANVSLDETDTDDCFGQGHLYTVRYQMPTGTQLIQTFAFYDPLPYFVVALSITNPDSPSACNYLAPLKSQTQTVFMPRNNKNRVLFVPFDNDGFIRYSSNYLRNNATDSYYVTAIYNSVTREGFVAGAVDHYYWKNAVHVKGSDYYNLDELTLISGYTDDHSHDSIQSEGHAMPHGVVVADTVRSSRFVVGFYDDWRTGMETFGQACTRVAPRREWAGGTPYGWSSWGVQSTDISYQGVIDCADFIRDNLMPHGFHDLNGKVVMSLDAWWNENLSDSQVRQFVSYCKSNNMIPGLYYGPFCRFGDLQSHVPGTNNRYRFRDIALKVHNRYKVIDGAYCLDPTHPGTKMFMLNDINRFKQWGIEYLKCDFQSNGIIEADSWYTDTCFTGMQAYNIGMAYLMKRTGDDIYIDLSISPAFPYHYAHGRRISCDAWGTISSTQYVMNCASYGWWLGQVYVANDPDHMVMCMRQEAGGIQDEGANRARITSGAVVGAFLTGDNFSPNVTLHDGDGQKRPNYYETSQSRALTMLTNPDINEIPRTCNSFRPLYGNASQSVGAENMMSYENERYVYVAVLNYQMLMPQQGDIPYSDIGLDPANVGEIKELWMQETVIPSDAGLHYNVPGYDARIYRIEKKQGAEAIHPIDHLTNSSSDYCYDLQGRRISNSKWSNSKWSNSQIKKGLYIQAGKKIIVK